MLKLAIFWILAQAGSLYLTWTAPGDDGDVGRAAEYDLRYCADPLDSLNFGDAVRCAGVPAPDSAGTHQVFRVTGLEPGVRYWFALRTRDNAGNWSRLSNVASRVARPEGVEAVVVATATRGGR